jgi:hypothetical protein
MAFTLPPGLGDISAVIKRFGKAKQRRELWRSLFQEAYDFALPQKETFNFHSPGQKKNRHIYDSTAVAGVRTYAARIQSSHTPPWKQWFNFVAGTDTPKGDRDSLNKQLEEATDIFFNHLNESDYSNQSTESDQDLAISTGAMFFEEGNELEGEPLFKFTSIPLGQLYLEAGEGAKNTGWREHETEARNIPLMWPEGDFGADLQKKIDKTPDEKVKIINGVLKANGEFHQIVIYEAKKQLIFTQSFTTSPLIIYRTNVIPGEVYGRGPVLDVLPDIRTANKVKEYILKNGALQMTGVYTGATDSGWNPHTAVIAPGSIIPVSSNSNQNPSLKPLENSGRLDVGQIILEDLQANINNALFANPLGDVDDPVKSATEQMLRTQEMLRSSGASFGRLNTEKIKALVERGVDILSTNGRLPKIKVDGKEVAIKMQSPLAKAEAQEEFQAFQVWWAQMQTLPPEVVALGAQVENIPNWTAEKLGLPTADLARTKEQIKEASQQIIESAQQQEVQDGTVTGE